MGRDESVSYSQDNLGNERKQIDNLRAQEGMVQDGASGGLIDLGSADTGAPVTVFGNPEHATNLYLDRVEAYSEGGAGDTFTVFEVERDEDGNITDSTRRSIPHQIESGNTRIVNYRGEQFDGDIAVSTEFEGFVGVSVLSDHEESDEPVYDQ